MTGYSGTPLVKKLGITPGHRLAILDAPEGFDSTLGELPDGADVRRTARGRSDVIVCFVTRRRRLVNRMPILKRALEYDGGLWFCWPKRSAGVETDVTEDVIRDLALKTGLVDNKVCAVDETWSGLRLVYRLSDRP